MSPKSTSSKTKLDTLLSIPKRFLSHKPNNTTSVDKPNTGAGSGEATSRERIKRAELKIQVITQPRLKPNLREMPRSATRVLTILYEALTQAKNCEVPTRDFWSRFATSQKTLGYTVAGLERTLETVGVECNSHENGRPTSTGRWILLKHGHFLLRAAHTIQWIENPLLDSILGGDDMNIDKSAPSIVWDWKSGAERWRWDMYEISIGGAMMVAVEEGCEEHVS